MPDGPDFIRLHDYVVDDDPISIVSEYVTGRTLSHVLHQQGRLPPDEVISYVRQLARALDEAHQHKLSRRKLLPSNLFLDGSRAFSKCGDAMLRSYLFEAAGVLLTRVPKWSAHGG